MAGIPKPLIDTDSRTFWEGVQNHKLMLQNCDDCHEYIFYPRMICPHCFSDNLTWKETSGKGKIQSYTVVHKAPPEFRDEVPYVIGIIDLEEGVRMLSRIIGDRDKISIEKPVSVVYKKIDDELTLPYFKLSEV
ncbi:Zn-ribbon domain-containing OB-fold protein [Alkalihalobacillus deserti]|uniref:Zn-ribbon domain-containing OB-fold protein n=1 Tax=Alkalihalobacillus deserti TaxID=2879466 RepID=UPI001D138A35|nr:Zn-ribbon domain-containing OB-fold protein [Alkalihalobacillus deserti]